MSIFNQPEVTYFYFQFNKIYALESLPPGERQTGKELYDDVLRWAAYRVVQAFLRIHRNPKGAPGTLTAIRWDVWARASFRSFTLRDMAARWDL